MEIKKYDSGLLHSCMYVLEENRHALVIDPCGFTECAKDFQVDYMILTHEHYDHISGVNVWKEKTGAKVLCSEACAVNIENPRKNMSRYFEIFCMMQTWVPQEEIKFTPGDYSCRADLVFRDEKVFNWQGHTIVLTEIPGHSAGSIGISVDDEHFFSGDSLLEHDPIELRLPGGSKEQWEMIGRPRIESLRKGIRIWPGHFEDFILK